MRSKATTYVRFLTIFMLLGTLGIASTVYVLVQQRFTLPFQSVYTISARFSAAHGVLGGIGQPVDVVGVQVGQVKGVKLESGTAVVAMQLQRDQLPHVYANATAALTTVTPLGDARIDLEPGSPPARPLSTGATIDLSATSAPVPLSDLLSTLDGDTRNYLTGLIAAVGQGTQGQADNIRRMLLSLGPTSQQVREISSALAQRRTDLARFVHNLAALTRAASRDGQLASVVAAGDQTLRALAEQDRPLQESIARLPATLTVAKATLSKLTPFANELGPTLSSLDPAVSRLPTTLRALGRFSHIGAAVVRHDVVPLVSAATPLLREAAPAVSNLTHATPPLVGAAQSLNYLLNELGYVPGGSDQGFLFWLDWAAHNTNSSISTQDANGAVARAAAVVDCNGAQSLPALQAVFSIVNACPH